MVDPKARPTIVIMESDKSINTTFVSPMSVIENKPFDGSSLMRDRTEKYNVSSGCKYSLLTDSSGGGAIASGINSHPKNINRMPKKNK
jgi:hypothetical protein